MKQAAVPNMYIINEINIKFYFMKNIYSDTLSINNFLPH